MIRPWCSRLWKIITNRSDRLGVLCWSAAALSIAMLALLLGVVLWKALTWPPTEIPVQARTASTAQVEQQPPASTRHRALDWRFLTNFDSRKPENAGILAGMLGTFWVIAMTAFFSVPIGVGAAVYLEEYSTKGRLTRLIQLNLSNLAGVPSIVYGILGLTVFVRMFGMLGAGGLVERWTGQHLEGLLWSENFRGWLIPLPFGRVAISGALTLTLLILPVIIIATQEALRAVPPSIRNASLALGATKWQTIRHQVLPAATPGIMTGVILAISRAMGETAPLVMMGAMTFVFFAPGKIDSLSAIASNPEGLVKAPFDVFTVMPIQIYYWVGLPNARWEHVAAAGIVVLLTFLLVLNGLAIYIRNRFSKHLRW